MHERNLYDMNEAVQSSHQLRTFILGAAIGAGLALLLAPATGSDTRKKLGEKARHLKDQAGDKMSHLREDAKETMSHLREDAKEAVDSGREAYRQTRDNLSAAKTGAQESRPRT